MIRKFFTPKAPREATLPPKRRVYAVGDIHGRLDLLEKILNLIAADQEKRATVRPEIIFLGDLVDRGPDSAGVVRRLMEPPSWARVAILMGNHESAMLTALGGDYPALDMWLNVGGREALQSWGMSAETLDEGGLEDIVRQAFAIIPQDELAWLTQLRQNMQIGDYFFVHAGVRPGVALDRQNPYDNMWIRDDFLSSKQDHGAMIVHGHTIAPDVVERSNRIGIDTGAYQSGKLTALCLEGAARWYLQT
jgi:serine/threonine protein phosphatase 1